MKNAESVLVKFNSIHGYEKLMNICQEDLEIFRNVPGLIQKYYMSEESTCANSGFYIFETKSAREAFWVSEPARYGVIPQTLRVEQYEMAIVLNDVLFAGKRDPLRNYSNKNWC